MHRTVQQIFVGGLHPLPPEGQVSGIFKEAVAGPVLLSVEGLAGDRHGDPRYHGGPEKALHHYPAEHYAALALRWPAAAQALRPGALGENLSTTGWTEQNVCVGDVFRIGPCRVQVSQPRQPCWKINHRIGEAGLSAFIAEQGLVGWYCRVLEGGVVEPGATFELLERPGPDVTLARLWAAGQAHRPDPAELEELAAAPGLTPAWVRKLTERAAWLRQHETP